MAQALHDIIVVSDLHLGRGKNPETGRFDRLEAFFYDEDFAHFCAELVRDASERGIELKLVLNGDTFDLLRLEPEQSVDGNRPRYAPPLTPARAAEMVHRILEGHPLFVRGLAEVLEAGHRLVFIAGNHDAEVQWEPVQDEIRRAILAEVARLTGGSAVAVTEASARLVFEGWFHHEPGRIWIEHGCQYDPENAFTYQLRRRFAELPDDVIEAEVDLPLGTFFQRYLYNSFGSITFIVPTSKSNFRYFRWLVLNRPRLLASTFTRHMPFFLQVMRRLAKLSPSEEPLRQRHQEELQRLIQTDPAGDRLIMVDQLKQVKGSASIVAREIIMRLLKGSSYLLLGAFLAGALWFVGFHAISTMTAGFGFKAVLFLTLNFMFLIATVGGLAYFLLRPAGAEADPKPRAAAAAISRLVEVPLVTFGHTHEEVIIRFDRGAEEPGWYFNTGTWIAVFTADSLLPRERVQYTFLRVRGHRGELLHWSPGRKQATPVVLLEEDRDHDQPDRPSAPAAS